MSEIMSNKKYISSIVFLVLSSIFVVKHSIALDYDHLGSGSESQSYDTEVGSSEYISLNIKNTCEGAAINAVGLTPANPTANPTANPIIPVSAITSDTVIASCDKVISTVNQALMKFQEDNHACLIVPSIKKKIPNDSKYTGFIIDVTVSKDDGVKNGIQKSDIAAIIKASTERCTNALDTMVTAANGKLVKSQEISDEALKTRFLALEEDISNFANQQISQLLVKPIKNTNLVINTNVKGWVTEFSGGILVSSLTDKKYRVDVTDSVVKFVRNRGAEDNQRLELGAFTHVYHSKWEGGFFKTGTPAITAGISVNNGDSLDYFIGGSLKFGSAYLNLGWHWGQVGTGPSAYPVNSPLTIDTATATAALTASADETRTDDGIFLSISFTFAGQGASPIKSRLAFPKSDKP